jgi:hypothetical protein
MGVRGRERVLRDFTFEAQARHYERFFGRLGWPQVSSLPGVTPGKLETCRDGRNR